MRAAAVFSVMAAIGLTGCGLVDGSAAADELRAVVERDDDVDPRWASFSVRSPAEITVADGRPEVAAVWWTSSYENERTVEGVTGSSGCDSGCLAAAEQWSRDRLADGPMPAATNEGPCFMCEYEDHLSLISVDGAGDIRAVERSEIAGIVGEIDTAYEAMLVVGRSARVRPEGDGWRAVLFEITNDCDPVVEEYTMWSVGRDGTTDRLAQIEISDDSCI